MSGAGLDDYPYTPEGQVATITRFSDLAGTQEVAESLYSYDPVGNVTAIENVGASGNVIDDFQCTYDPAGELISETDNGVPTNYVYDATGQLVGAGGNGYTYDPNGNRTMPGYVIGPDNQVLSDGTFNYTYDAQGNTLTKTDIATGDQWSYGYDPENHLISAVEANAQGGIEVQAEYKYDVFGNRIEQDVWTPQSGAQVQLYALDGWNPAKLPSPSGRGAGGEGPVGNENFDVWADLDANGSLTTRYVRGDTVDELFGRVDVAGGASSTSWTLTDHLGSVRDVIDNGGVVKDSIAYDAYGNITSEANPVDRGRYAWSGRELDVETGLQYNRARYYDSTTGRWVSQDPMGFDAGDSNLYRYVKNAPTDATDPSGDDSIQIGQGGEILWVRTPNPNAPLGRSQYIVIGKVLGGFPYNFPEAMISGLVDYQSIEKLKEIAGNWKDYLGPDAYNAFWAAAAGAQKQTVAKEVSAILKTPLGKYGPVVDDLTPLLLALAEVSGVANVEQAWTGKDLQNNPLSIGQRIWLGTVGSIQLIVTAVTIQRFVMGPGAAPRGYVAAGPGQLAPDLAQHAGNVIPRQGFTDVFLHSTADSFQVLHNGQWVSVSHRSIATWLRSNGVTGNVRLIACESGQGALAQNLANQLGVSVEAATTRVFVPTNFQSAPLLEQGGQWITFRPGVRP